MKHFSYIVSLLFFSSCQMAGENNCAYTLQQLVATNDSSRFKIINHNGESERTEIVDSTGQECRSFYLFDENDVLRFYAFLVDTTNGYDFSVVYDSTGQEISRSGQDVVFWFFEPLSMDSFSANFLIYAVNNEVRNIKINYNGQSILVRKLYPSKYFSSILESRVRLKYNSLKDTIFIRGLRRSKCSVVTREFEDFVTIPEELKSILK